MKPRKKYIQHELIEKIEADIKEVERDLKKHWVALRNAILGNFETKITDYHKTDWYVAIDVLCESELDKKYSQYLFINKKTGKNRYPEGEHK